MYDRPGTPEAQYWIARNRIRSEFGLTIAEADEEMHHLDEVLINLAIWDMQSERQEKENKRNS